MKWEFWELCNIFQTFYFQENLQPSASQPQAANSVSQDIAFYQNLNSFVKTGEYQTPGLYSQNLLKFIEGSSPKFASNIRQI